MFKKLKKIIGIMTDKDISELREEYSQFSYQWIKGEEVSKVQHYKDIVTDGNKKYLAFTDGTRISLDLLDEYMIRVEKGFEDIIIPEPPISLPQAQQAGIKPRETQEKKVITKESPIFSLLSKQKSNWVDVDLKLSINLPPKSLWDVLISSFEEAETDILEYVTKDLDIEVVRQSLRESIKEIYKKQKNLNPAKNVRPQDSISE